jgi:molybdopterin converting factor subunit 1
MTASVHIRVLFFGMVRDIVGRREDSLEVPEGGRLTWVFEHYATLFPRLKELSASIVLALNQEFAAPSNSLAEGDEVAFLPPVSGGSSPYTHEIADPAGHFYAITRDPIQPGDLRHRLLRGQDGATVLFEGVARNNTKGRPTRYLEYECYEAMAVKMMAQIGGEIARSLPISRIGMIHRLGRIEIGEASVIVAATAPHRKPAFDAAIEGINRLKKLVPVWKKEYFADGEVWVDGEWDDSVITARS